VGAEHRDLGGLFPWKDAAVDETLKKAQEAFLSMSEVTGHADPLAGALVLSREELGLPSDPASLLAYWSSRCAGSPGSEMRYRWELSHRRGAPLPPYAGSPAYWSAWRPREQSLLDRDPFAFEEQFLLPILLADNLELLTREADRGDPTAAALLAEAAPTLRRDFAQFIQVLQPFRDTFGLGYLTRRPRALSALHPLAVALATCYAAVAREKGRLEGYRFPFADRPLLSPTAQLATGLLCLGLELDLVPALVEFVRGRQLPHGGFGDDSDGDVLTTLCCAELLASVDPAFDPATARAYLLGRASPDGLFRVLGPEALWLTARVIGWCRQAERSFAERFTFPYLPEHNRDQKTGLPFFAYFADLFALFSALPGLASARVELVFIDLAGFRAFNNAHGQDRGDDVLRVFGGELARLPFASAIRDGGDEFLLVGAPGSRDLAATLDRFRAAWPATFRDTFGADVPPVAPRVLVGHTVGARLMAAREILGRTITSLKYDVIPGPEGIQRNLGKI
jgi:hypothetical protein